MRRAATTSGARRSPTRRPRERGGPQPSRRARSSVESPCAASRSRTALLSTAVPASHGGSSEAATALGRAARTRSVASPAVSAGESWSPVVSLGRGRGVVAGAAGRGGRFVPPSPPARRPWRPSAATGTRSGRDRSARDAGRRPRRTSARRRGCFRARPPRRPALSRAGRRVRRSRRGRTGARCPRAAPRPRRARGRPRRPRRRPSGSSARARPAAASGRASPRRRRTARPERPRRRRRPEAPQEPSAAAPVRAPARGRTLPAASPASPCDTACSTRRDCAGARALRTRVRGPPCRRPSARPAGTCHLARARTARGMLRGTPPGHGTAAPRPLPHWWRRRPPAGRRSVPARRAGEAPRAAAGRGHPATPRSDRRCRSRAHGAGSWRARPALPAPAA